MPRWEMPFNVTLVDASIFWLGIRTIYTLTVLKNRTRHATEDAMREWEKIPADKKSL